MDYKVGDYIEATPPGLSAPVRAKIKDVLTLKVTLPDADGRVTKRKGDIVYMINWKGSDYFVHPSEINESSDKQNLKEFDLTDISVWEAIFAGGLFEVGRMAVDLLVAIGFIALSGISISAAVLINKVRQVRKDRKAVQGAKEAQEWLASTPEIKEFYNLLKDVNNARSKMYKTKRPVDGGDDATYKAATKAFNDLSKKRKTIGLNLYKKAVDDGLSNEALNYLEDNVEYMMTAAGMYNRRTTNEGIMSELDLMAQEAADVKDFLNDVLSDPAYSKHKGDREVMDFLVKFYEERRGAVTEQSNTLASKIRNIVLEEYEAIKEAMLDTTSDYMIGDVPVSDTKQIQRHISKLRDQHKGKGYEWLPTGAKTTQDLAALLKFYEPDRVVTFNRGQPASSAGVYVFDIPMSNIKQLRKGLKIMS